MNTKYKLLENDYEEVRGKKLYRIEALRDIGNNVKTGDKGGYIESENNLSASDNAWISGDAWVSGNARVSGNAWVSGNAQVYGNARISDNTWITGNARISDNTWITGNARVIGNTWITGNARITGNADWLTIVPIGSRNDTTTFTQTTDGIYVACGCFYGSIDEFRAAVKKTHTGTKHERDYMLACELAESRMRGTDEADE